MPDIHHIKARLDLIKKRKSVAPVPEFLELLENVNNILENEDPDYRPYDSGNLPGGIIHLDPDVKTILVPDLHARINFIYTLMVGQKCKNLSLLADNRLQIVCLGDGLHSEGHIRRWLRAYKEYKNEYKNHHNMDKEMVSGLGTMEMIMYLKCQFPGYFHYLKGNHDNIADETDNGNFAFYKFADEGAMVTKYMVEIMGVECLKEYYRFEKNLPLLAVGRNFIASHAEPALFFNEDSVIEYRTRPDVILGLTWTDNNKAQQGSVEQMIRYYIDEDFRDHALYFGGHRPVNDLFFTRAQGKYIQIHNPRQFNIAVIEPGERIDPQKAVRSIHSLLPFFLK